MPAPRTTLLHLEGRVLVVALSLAVLAIAAPAQARTLKIATIVPDGSSWLVEMREAGDRILERTEGRVKLKFYPGGVMGSDKTVLRKVRAGQLHGGAFTSGALADIYPNIELYSLPLLFRDYEEVTLVRKEMDQKLKDGLEANGFVAMSITDGGFAYILSQSEIRTVEDAAGAKVWQVEDDRMTAITLKVAKVSPVPLPISDVYTALQTGLIDTVAAPPMGAIAFQWHTKVKYLTDVPLMYLVGVLAIDKRPFAKISSPDQAIVREELETAGRNLDAESRSGEANAREALANQGIKFVPIESGEELARWRDISEQAIRELRIEGIYDESLIRQMLSIVETHRSGPAANP
jgi:TRAP-type C4-dicarboxylate transport system substrate-binding protein